MSFTTSVDRRDTGGETTDGLPKLTACQLSDRASRLIFNGPLDER